MTIPGFPQPKIWAARHIAFNRESENMIKGLCCALWSSCHLEIKCYVETSLGNILNIQNTFNINLGCVNIISHLLRLALSIYKLNYEKNGERLFVNMKGEAKGKREGRKDTEREFFLSYLVNCGQWHLYSIFTRFAFHPWFMLYCDHMDYLFMLFEINV